VESQLLLFDAGEFADVFVGLEFVIYPRLFLGCDIRRPKIVTERTDQAEETHSPSLPPELILTAWTPQDYQAAGELIYASYVGHTDALINDQYRTLHGSLRFLHNIVRFPGCGTFEATFSWMLRDRKTGALVGMVLCSRVGPQVAHVTQLCVAKAYRGRGLGLALLQQSADVLLRAGFEAITLTVTEANVPAVQLYKRFGFSLMHRFDAMAMDTLSKRR
jgi:ribosomal protein S18 acetylase RimI-like enzyme